MQTHRSTNFRSWSNFSDGINVLLKHANALNRAMDMFPITVNYNDRWAKRFSVKCTQPYYDELFKHLISIYYIYISIEKHPMLYKINNRLFTFINIYIYESGGEKKCSLMNNLFRKEKKSSINLHFFPSTLFTFSSPHPATAYFRRYHWIVSFSLI